MYYFLNLPFGVSTGYGNLVKIILPKTKLSWLNSESFTDVLNWRFFFIAGIIIGAFISARTMGIPLLTLEMGLFTQNVPWSFVALVFWFLFSGILLGLGARIAGGCTSGHGIHGLANFHPSSLVATVCFLLSGAATVFLIRILILNGGI
jgi:hypothetical protein